MDVGTIKQPQKYSDRIFKNKVLANKVLANKVLANDEGDLYHTQ